MDETFTWAWLIGGVLLLLAEIMLPGLVALFLGAAAVIVAGLRFTGLIEGVAMSFAAWMGLSIALTVGLRNTMRRLLPAETSRRNVDEDVEALGTIVDVLETVNEDDSSGRIRYQGTTWSATSTRGQIPAGAKAHLLVRDNLVWLVEPLDELSPGDLAASVAAPDDNSDGKR